jgi:spore coat protein U-like protein
MHGNITMMRRLALALLLLACGALPAEAASCRTPTATGVVFGTYTGTLVEITGTITVHCTNGAAYDVGLSGGDSGSVTARTMENGAYKLNYALTSVSYTGTNWGNTSPTWVTGTGSGANQVLTVYGELAAAQYVAPGAYTDTITVTVSGASFTTKTTTFTVTATVVKDCGVSATNLAFGNYTGAVNNSTSTVTVTCTNTTTYTVGLSAGLATGATVTTRKMQDGTYLLNYALYSNSTHTTNWGNTAATNWVAGTGSGIAQPLTVYGQIAAAQYVTPGSYTDTITATVTY